MDRRTPMLLAIAFAAVALLLAAIGIYGVLAYDVRERTREIAIRVALGADRATVLAMVFRDGATMVGTGVALGVAGTLLLRGVIESQLYEVDAYDPMVLTAVSLVLVIVACLACLVPACRAVKTEPTLALADQ
jgi:putative ABC transport system permease protein